MLVRGLLWDCSNRQAPWTNTSPVDPPSIKYALVSGASCAMIYTVYMNLISRFASPCLFTVGAMSGPILSPSSNWPGYDLTDNIGALYLGAVISFILSGITIMQAYLFFPSKDKLLIQIAAAIMVVMDVVSTALVAQVVYSYVVPNFGSLVPLGNLKPSLAAECGVSMVIVLLSHLYFAYQIFSVVPNGKAKYVVPGLVTFLGTVSLVGGIGCVVVMFKESHDILTDQSRHFSVFVGIAKGFAAITDVLATLALCFYINSALPRSEFARTNSMIKRLLGYTLQRGVLVTIMQAALVIVFFSTTTKFAWLALHINVTRIYAVTFFATLNGRHTASSKENNTYGLTTSITRAGTYNGSVQAKELQLVPTPTAYNQTTHGPIVTIEKRTDYMEDAA
ncbi:hypothetical protein R3P38DRAFT_2846544 [Favolaschia claudopus]|uniref:DUF6534 domain-containing protein n=1 Tax=Favolaschia claudopus TaxID=2862362 RepID=A0AAW0DRE1_9AGAR